MTAVRESDAARRLRLITALEQAAPLADTAGQAVIAAELSAGEREGMPSPLPPRPVVVLPGGPVAYLNDPKAFLDWATSDGRGADLLDGASLGRVVVAALVDQQPVPGVTFTARDAAVLLSVPAGAAIARQEAKR